MDKKILLSMIVAVAVLTGVLVFYKVNTKLAPQCGAVNSYRGCLAPENTTESKFCRTRSRTCTDGGGCEGRIKKSCVPFYRF